MTNEEKLQLEIAKAVHMLMLLGYSAEDARKKFLADLKKKQNAQP